MEQSMGEQADGLFAFAPDALLVVCDDLIVLANEAAQRLFSAHSPARLQGQSPLDLTYPDDHDLMRACVHIGEADASIGDTVTDPVELRVVRMDGSAVDAEVVAARIEWNGARAVLLSLRDVSERRKADERLRHSRLQLLEQHSILADLAKSDAFRGTDPSATFRSLTETAARVMRIDRVSVWQLSDDGRAMCCIDTFDRRDETHATSDNLLTAAAPHYMNALRFGSAIVTDDPHSDSRTSELSSAYLTPLGITAVMDIPLHVGGELRGSLRFEQVGLTLPWTPEERVFGLALANLVTLAVEQDERRRAESALRDSEQRFRQLAENIEEVFWMTTIDVSRVLYASTAFERVWGRSLDALLQNTDGGFLANWSSWIVEEDRAAARAAIEGITRTGGYEIEYRIVRGDGAVRWIRDRAHVIHDANGTPYRLAGVAEDVTERREADEAIRSFSRELEQRVRERTRQLESANDQLRSSEGRLRALVEALPDMMFRLTRTGYILDCTARRSTGFIADSVVGKRFSEIALPPSVVDNCLVACASAIDSGEMQSLDISVPDPSGSREYEARVVRSGADEVVAILRDITERKQAEEHRTQLESQLRRAQKMEAVGTLAGGIAHDFNNILTAVLGYTALLERDLQDNAKALDRLGRITAAGVRAKDLVREILTFSRQQEQQRQVVRLQSVVKEALKLLRAAIPTTIEMHKQIDEDTPAVFVDATQMHQVVMNLTVNASHAMEDTVGDLYVSLGVVDVDAEFASEWADLRPGRYVRLQVRDTGCGIDDATLDRIFEPFFTTKGPTKGTGLGLAVVHGIVRDHDGVITVESEVGQGSTFSVYLPTTEVAESAVDVVAPRLVAGAGQRIMVVDDEPSIAELSCLVLQSLGYAVVQCSSASEALRAVGENAAFDCIITDLAMPGKTGLELAEEVHAQHPEIPFILCTGYGGSITEDRSKAAGIRRTLLKPFMPADLSTVLHEVLSDSAQAA